MGSSTDLLAFNLQIASFVFSAVIADGRISLTPGLMKSNTYFRPQAAGAYMTHQNAPEK